MSDVSIRVQQSCILGPRAAAPCGVRRERSPLAGVGLTGGVAEEPQPAPVVEAPAVAGRLVQVTIRSEAPLKGGRALLALKKAQALGPVGNVTPSETAFENDDFDGRFSFRIETTAPYF